MQKAFLRGHRSKVLLHFRGFDQKLEKSKIKNWKNQRGCKKNFSPRSSIQSVIALLRIKNCFVFLSLQLWPQLPVKTSNIEPRITFLHLNHSTCCRNLIQTRSQLFIKRFFPARNTAKNFKRNCNLLDRKYCS